MMMGHQEVMKTLQNCLECTAPSSLQGTCLVPYVLHTLLTEEDKHAHARNEQVGNLVVKTLHRMFIAWCYAKN